VVRTQLEQDGKPLLSKDLHIAVRCYEARQTRLGATHTNMLADYSTMLWSKPDDQDWTEVGEGDHTFRIVVPANATAPSTALYYQEYRIFWRVEATLNHIPINGVGSRMVKHFDLPLIRYDVPPLIRPPSPPMVITSSHLYATAKKTKGPQLRYRVVLPPQPVGPLDIVPIQIYVQPMDSSVVVRSATAVVERRITLKDAQSLSQSGSGTPTVPIAHPPDSTSSSYAPSVSASPSASSPYPAPHHTSPLPGTAGSVASSSSQDLASTASASTIFTDSDSRPLLPSSPGPDKVATHIYAHVESSVPFKHDSDGIWKQTLNFSWPDTKSKARWGIGETARTEMANVQFFIRPKLIVSSLSSNAESFELEDQEIFALSTNESQRQVAFSKYNEQLYSNNRSKSKSPRRTRRERDRPPDSPNDASTNPLSSAPPHVQRHLEPSLAQNPKFPSTSPYPTKAKVKAHRRPHTSAGPRDKSVDLRASDTIRHQNHHLVVPVRAETAISADKAEVRTGFNQKWVLLPELGSSIVSTDSGISIKHEESADHADGVSLFGHLDQSDVLAWEQELARIESASRRSSADMLGFASRRKQGHPHHRAPAVRPYLLAEG